MKILHISKFYPPYRGGIEDICFSVVSALKSNSTQIVVCFNDNSKNTLSRIDDVEVARAGILGEFASQPISFSYYFLIRKYIKEFKPDIIHLHLPNPLACLYLLSLIPRQTKLIIHWHSDIVAQKYIYKLFAPIEKSILQRSNKILVTSPQYLEYSDPLSKYKYKSVVIPNVISLEKMNLKSKNITDELIKERYKNKDIIFFMGRHVPYKGIEYLIEAEKYIKSDCVILIAGAGPITKDLFKKVTSDRIHFIGRIPDDEIGEYMKAASIFAFPSITKNEAFGVVLAEAMYCKAVPVTFTIEGSGVNWVNLNGVTGIEVKNGDAKAYGEAITYLLNNPIQRKKYAENAHIRIKEMFTINAIKNSLINVYNDLLKTSNHE